MTFRQADINDLDRITEIYEAIHSQEEAGLASIGWDRKIYPTRETAAASINAGDMFVGCDGDTIFGSAKINQEQVPEYAGAAWDYEVPNEQVMVLHTLTIDPHMARQGYASAFERFYCEYAKAHGCDYLRIDTNEKNVRARSLYKKLGYKEIGIVPCIFNGIAGVSLVCLEKKI